MFDSLLSVASQISDLDLCDYYLQGTLKDTVYVNNPHFFLQELEDSIQREIATISTVALLCVEKYSQKYM